MPQLNLDIPHTLDPDDAMQRIKKNIVAARTIHHDRLSEFREEWRDHTLSFAFKALGFAVSGTVAIERECVRLAAALPLSLMFFKGAIEDRIRREVDGILAPADNPDDAKTAGNNPS
jgi:hypothetical protein